MKITNFTNNRGCRIPNQFEIETDKEKFFQSYDSIIVKIEKETNKTYLDAKYWNYSQTTGKYRNIFLREDKKATEQKIKKGIYILTNLN
jgi:hypothetical protein